MLQKIASGLTRKPKIVALIAVLLLIPSIIGYVLTGINYDILSYLPSNLDSSKGMDLLQSPFNMAATSMLIVEDMPSGYSSNLANEIKNVPGVSNCIGFSNLLGVQIPNEMIPANFRDVLFSGNAQMMIVQYEGTSASEETMHAIEEIRNLCNEKCHLAGFSVIIKDTKDIMNKELPIFVGLAVVLAFVAMEVTLEETLLPLILIANIGIAIVYNFGSNIFLGQISYITKAIAAVLQLGVTMDYSIFLYRRFEEEKAHYEDPRDAMAQAIIAAFRSLTGSSLTTIAGFLALCFMQLTLGMDIGIVMAKGVVLGVITVILVMPAIVLLAQKKLDAKKHKSFIPDLSGLNNFVIEHRKAFAIVTLILFIPAYYAQSHAEMYYKLDESLPATLPSRVANAKLKDEFGMSTSHFALVSDQLTSVELTQMENEIHDLNGISSMISYHTMLGSGIPDFFVPSDIRSMLKQGGYQLMMINSEYETASTEVAKQLSEMTAIIKKYDPNAYITGEAAMTNDLIETTAVDFVTTNYISIAAIFLIVMIVFKSISVPAVLVAVIELSIFLNQGVPYFTGDLVPFIAPTIIGCVQLGATVDYAILMTSRFQEELKNGKDRIEAAKIAANASDESIITSALVLFCATLGVSFVSSIDLIGSICVTLARGAVISAAVIIVLLPALLVDLEPLFNKTSLNWKTDAKKVKG